jgi:hypothetical protein
MRVWASRFSRQSAVVVGTLLLSPVPALVAHEHQYTWSLLLFALPSALIAFWFFVEPGDHLKPARHAFALTLVCLIPLGWLLNLFFAGTFFRYPEPKAVMGWSVNGLTFHGFTGPAIPLEEFAFYATGFLTLLLIYLWGDHTFFARYQANHREKLEEPIVQLALGPAVMAVVVVGVAWLMKSRAGEDGFPGYFAFLMLLPFTVTLTLWKRAKGLINWQAFSFMALWLLGMSVLWEASLALPGGWWNYQHPHMMGLYIHPWSELPLEAVLVWVLTGYTTVVFFEAMRVHAHRRRPGG